MPETLPPKPAFVEDEDPVTGEVDPETRKSANSGAKRSSQQSLNKEKLGRPSPPSDSGVSGLSHGSDSRPSAKTSRAAHKVEGVPPPPPPPAKRRGTVNGRDREYERERERERERGSEREYREREKDRVRRHESRRDVRHRSPDKHSRDNEARAQQQASAVCMDPNCWSCPPMRRQPRPALDTGMVNNYHPSYYAPQSPASTQFPPSSAVPIPSYGGPPDDGSRPRRLSYAGTQSRPVSCHGYSTSAAYQSSAAGLYPGSPSSYPVSPMYDLYKMATRTGFGPAISSSPRETSTRVGVPNAMTDDLDYSTRVNTQPPPLVPTYNNKSSHRDSRDYDDNITPRPSRRDSYKAPPGAYSTSETSESSPERASSRQHRRNDSHTMPPPARPALRHASTTSDAVPMRSTSRRAPVLVQRYGQSEYAYESPSDHYDTDRTTKAVISDSSRRRDSLSRHSDTSYKTFISDPLHYGRNERGPPPGPIPSRRYSVNDRGMKRQQVQQDAAISYQDDIRGYSDDRPMTAEWLLEQRRQRLPDPRTPSAISGSSHRSHKSHHSISSRTSANGSGMIVQYGDTTLQLSDGHTVSVERNESSGGSRLIIEDHRERSSTRFDGGSANSSSAARNGEHSRRRRGERETSRGRRPNVS